MSNVTINTVRVEYGDKALVEELTRKDVKFLMRKVGKLLRETAGKEAREVAQGFVVDSVTTGRWEHNLVERGAVISTCLWLAVTDAGVKPLDLTDGGYLIWFRINKTGNGFDLHLTLGGHGAPPPQASEVTWIDVPSRALN
jgi:hypothetical protein